MDTLNSLYNQIDEFLQTNDQQTIDKFLQWFQTRTRFNETNASSSNFVCSCGHRYAIRWSIETTQRAKRSSNNANHNSTTSKLFICTHCQIRLHTRETFLQHYSMHQQGLNYCKRCFQFHSDDDESHQCSTNKNETKFDELKSLEELIPPETIDSTESKEKISINEQETDSSAARLTRFGLPTLTDSVVEVIQPDGKRQFRCPLCLNSYVNRSGLNRHYITHSSQDLWKVGQYLFTSLFFRHVNQ